MLIHSDNLIEDEYSFDYKYEDIESSFQTLF